MGTLRISLFGSVRIANDDYPHAIRITRTVQALLAYLVLHRQRTLARDILTGLFWGNQPEDRARSCLSTALWRLRRALEPPGILPGTYILATPSGEVGFNNDSDYSLDVAEFERATGRFLRVPPTEASLEQAHQVERMLDVYSGELLEGFYDDWALSERERLRELYLHTLTDLMPIYRRQREYERCLNCGQRVLAVDPLREEVHREIMRVYLDLGQRALALRQYESCRVALASDLAVEPMVETRTLYAEAVARDSAQPSASPPAPADLQQVLRQLRQALDTFEQSRRLLQQALDSFEKTL